MSVWQTEHISQGEDPELLQKSETPSDAHAISATIQNGKFAILCRMISA